MPSKYNLVHTWKDMEKTEQMNSPCWRSSVHTYPEWAAAHSAMRSAFLKYANDNAESLITCSFRCDSAYLEYADGCKEIWTIDNAREG